VASLEEAEHCPKCDQVGEVQMTVQLGRREGKAITYHCKNQLCRWFNTGWVVQVLPDGSIPNPSKGEKQFPEQPFADSIARRELEQMAISDPTVARMVERLKEERG